MQSLASYTVPDLAASVESDYVSMDKVDKEAAVRIAVRYCILKNCSGLGYIEEPELKRLINLSFPAISNVRPILLEADIILERDFGMSLVAGMQTPSPGT